MSHEEEDDFDSVDQYKFKHLACNEKRNSIRVATFLGTRPIWSSLKMLVSILTLCLIVVILSKLGMPFKDQRNSEPVSAGRNNEKAPKKENETTIKATTTPATTTTESVTTPNEPYYYYIPSSISRPQENQFYIIMPTGSKYALTNEAGLISLTSYTFERNQLFRFSLDGRVASPKKFTIIDKTGNYFVGLGGNDTQLMGFEKGEPGQNEFQWLIRDQTHREGSFQIVPTTTDSCLAYDNQENRIVLEDCAPFRSTQYWLILPICGDTLLL